MRSGQSLGKSERLQYGHEFRKVYEQGRRCVGRVAVLYVRERTEPGRPSRRVGVVSGRRLGGAVKRNRARRLLREVYRQHKSQLKENIELVMVARPALLELSWSEIERELVRQFAEAGIWRGD
ncbi:MAG: ribonuclease P protein component [Verrucomicrobiae bacterium]|nr:ribonuclease P protein component [Verrucomicrobiae bacterium]